MSIGLKPTPAPGPLPDGVVLTYKEGTVDGVAAHSIRIMSLDGKLSFLSYVDAKTRRPLTKRGSDLVGSTIEILNADHGTPLAVISTNANVTPLGQPIMHLVDPTIVEEQKADDKVDAILFAMHQQESGSLLSKFKTTKQVEEKLKYEMCGNWSEPSAEEGPYGIDYASADTQSWSTGTTSIKEDLEAAKKKLGKKPVIPDVVQDFYKSQTKAAIEAQKKMLEDLVKGKTAKPPAHSSPLVPEQPAPPPPPPKPLHTPGDVTPPAIGWDLLEMTDLG